MYDVYHFCLSQCILSKEEEKKQPHHDWCLINCDRLVNLKAPGFVTQSLNSKKYFPKNIVHD